MSSPLQRIEIAREPARFLRSFFAAETYTRVAVVVDEHTEKHCYPHVRDALPKHALVRTPAGEPHKDISTCMRLWDRFLEESLDRHALVVILGGGVLGDMGGFCAATFKRGIDFMLVPTTLLAQVDAAVGGKLGVNFKAYKNQLGVFCFPRLTLISPLFLETLPDRLLRAGFAEVIKHHLIADRSGWRRLCATPWDDHDWMARVAHSVDIKMRIVQEDPHEKGPRKALNFGHTVGHAWERQQLAGGLLHGEAVAAGMIVEAYIAFQKKYIERVEMETIAAYINGLFAPCAMPERETLFNDMLQDKKNRDQRIMMALIGPVGQARWDVEVERREIENALDYYDELRPLSG